MSQEIKTFVIEVKDICFEVITTRDRLKYMGTPIAKALLHGFRVGSRSRELTMEIGKLKSDLHNANRRYSRLLKELQKCRESDPNWSRAAEFSKLNQKRVPDRPKGVPG